jgi:hypothetical protein
MTKRGVRIGTLSLASIVALSTTVIAQANKPASTTRPAIVSLEAFAVGDTILSSPDTAKAFAATPITFKCENMPALKALSEIGKLAGYKVKPAYDGWFQQGRNSPKSVTVSIVNQPFWAAVREVCARSGVNLYRNGGDEDFIGLAPGNYGGTGMMRSSASIKGPFMVCVNGVQRINTVDMSKPAEAKHEIHVNLGTWIEPKLKGEQVSYRATIDEAADDNGNDMTPTEKVDGHQNYQGGQGFSYWGEFTLPYPASNPGKRIARVKGHLAAKVQIGQESKEIEIPFELVDLPLP